MREFFSLSRSATNWMAYSLNLRCARYNPVVRFSSPDMEEGTITRKGFSDCWLMMNMKRITETVAKVKDTTDNQRLNGLSWIKRTTCQTTRISSRPRKE